MSWGQRLLWWLPAPLTCLVLYWYSLGTWYHQDDFAWLGLPLEVHHWLNLIPVVFSPKAQGTVRPWSERVAFLIFSKTFGLNALPFHIWVFLTQLANLALLQWIVRRLSGSAAVAVLAAMLWLANPGLATPMSWSSAYNQILCAFFLLLALQFLIRAVETGEKRFWTWQWVAFALGFGALEINVVYPGLAAAYLLFYAREHWKKAIPLFAVSAAYAALHFALIPKPAEGVYQRHWDLSVFSTLAEYGKMALGVADLTAHYTIPLWMWNGAAAVLAGFLVLVWVRSAVSRQWLPWFGLAWFVVVLAPVVSLRDHITDYYLAIPAAGVAMILAWGIAECWRRSWPFRIVALAVPVAYCALVLPKTREIVRWRYEVSQRVRAMVLGSRRAIDANPGKLVLLTGMTSETFWLGMFDDPFRLFAPQRVYLAPGEEKSIDIHPELGDITPWLTSRGQAERAVMKGQAMVYRLSGRDFQEVTEEYRKGLAAGYRPQPVRRVVAGETLFEDSLGEGWFAIESGFRWMSRKAAVRLAGPGPAGGDVLIQGQCPGQHFAKDPNPLTLRILVNTEAVMTVELRPGAPEFSLRVPLPAAVNQSAEFTLGLELDRVLQPRGETRELGLVFGQFEVQPYRVTEK